MRILREVANTVLVGLTLGIAGVMVLTTIDVAEQVANGLVLYDLLFFDACLKGAILIGLVCGCFLFKSGLRLLVIFKFSVSSFALLVFLFYVAYLAMVFQKTPGIHGPFFSPQI